MPRQCPELAFLIACPCFKEFKKAISELARAWRRLREGEERERHVGLTAREVLQERDITPTSTDMHIRRLSLWQDLVSEPSHHAQLAALIEWCAAQTPQRDHRHLLVAQEARVRQHLELQC